MLLKIHHSPPDWRKIDKAVEILNEGGIMIYPTDTVYALGCSMKDKKAVEKLCKLRGMDPKKASLSLICQDISQVSEFTLPIDNSIFRLIKKHVPGPFTFILEANNHLPKVLRNKRKTIGVRIPEHFLPQAIVQQLGHPLITTSLKSDDEILEYFTDPEEIYQDYLKKVDLFIDGGMGKNVPSTVVDCTSGEPEIIREGAGTLAIGS